ncbi:MAG: hypothetical protein GY807_19545 [Gammaproteobacteria bacterium]|nr:hypothetical protein [Gammaproteobacteria bacterium]
MDYVEQLTRLAFDYGPFMFAIFVLIYLTKRANENYAEVAARTSPKPSAEELRARKLVYYLAWFSGFALILISVSWWLYGNVPSRREYISFKIESLKSDDLLLPRDEDLYTRTIYYFFSDSGRENLFDYEILVPVTGDADQNRVIRLSYVPSESNVAQETVEASLEDVQNNKVFKIQIGEDGTPELVPSS